MVWHDLATCIIIEVRTNEAVRNSTNMVKTRIYSTYTIQRVCVLHTKHLNFILRSTHRHPGHPVSVPILPPRDTRASASSVLTSYKTELMHRKKTNQVSQHQAYCGRYEKQTTRKPDRLHDRIQKTEKKQRNETNGHLV